MLLDLLFWYFLFFLNAGNKVCESQIFRGRIHAINSTGCHQYRYYSEVCCKGDVMNLLHLFLNLHVADPRRCGELLPEHTGDIIRLTGPGAELNSFTGSCIYRGSSNSFPSPFFKI